MPVLESNETIGWLGVEGNTPGHPGYVTIVAGVPTVVSETDWQVGRGLDEIRRRLTTNVMRISSKLNAAVAMALLPSSEILRLADAEEKKAPEPDAPGVPAALAYAEEGKSTVAPENAAHERIMTTVMPPVPVLDVVSEPEPVAPAADVAPQPDASAVAPVEAKRRRGR